jgi:hypothetical protein
VDPVAFAVVDSAAGAFAVLPAGVLAAAVALVPAPVEVVGDAPRYLVLAAAAVVSSQTTVSNLDSAQLVSVPGKMPELDLLGLGWRLFRRESGQA